MEHFEVFISLKEEKTYIRTFSYYDFQSFFFQLLVVNQYKKTSLRHKTVNYAFRLMPGEKQHVLLLWTCLLLSVVVWCQYQTTDINRKLIFFYYISRSKEEQLHNQVFNKFNVSMFLTGWLFIFYSNITLFGYDWIIPKTKTC